MIQFVTKIILQQLHSNNSLWCWFYSQRSENPIEFVLLNFIRGTLTQAWSPSLWCTVMYGYKHTGNKICKRHSLIIKDNPKNNLQINVASLTCIPPAIVHVMNWCSHLSTSELQHSSRDCHGYRKMGSAGMGTVVDFGTPWHTTYAYCGIMGMYG